MQKQKRILICPLDWGLGHATRCIPIIRLLLKKNAEVVIAADGGPLALLKQEFPQLTFIQLKGYNIQYPKSGSMKMKMLLSIPKIVTGIKEEHTQLDKIIDDYKIDIVISDNRYGCWSKKVKSIFITHQLMIKAPIGESVLHNKVLKYTDNYDECWVPDLAGGNNLSGDLAHKFSLPKNTFFVGVLTRFSNLPLLDSARSDKTMHDIIAIISGPEPQRSVFEKLVIEQLKQTNLKALVVCGKASEEKTETIKNIKIVSHLKSEEMQTAIQNTDIILSRSGYSTVMDLANLGKKAIFIPTPGQTEQEYLAEMFMKKGIAFSQAQSSFDLKKALAMSENYKGFITIESGNELEKRIDLL
ncbi:MAG TPA: glycosyltransferase [Bacteroidia bacterium]|nr:glycosyltransferase [Bacteroidia bacterium]